MKENFYKAFEDRFRGSRFTIMERLRVYLPLIEPLKTMNPLPRVLDLGCGRGEWLELLNANSFQTHGIDMDSGMLESAREHALSVECIDAITYLKTLPDASIELVSGFHIAEHLEFDTLLELITHSHRVLVSGGLLILETPNPENITVGSNTFYTDPTHNRPIPPALFSFLPEYLGFEKTRIFRVNGVDYTENTPITLFDVIAGASPDYAIIAQKQAPSDILACFDTIWNPKYGFSMDELALRYSHNTQTTLHGLQTQIDESEHAIGSLTQQVGNFLESIESLTQRLERLSDENERMASELDGVYQSISWKLTSPLRHASKALRDLKSLLKDFRTAPKFFLKRLLLKVARQILARINASTRARLIALTIAGRFPNLAMRIKKKLSAPSLLIVDTHLTSRGERIYHDLKHAIEKARRTR